MRPIQRVHLHGLPESLVAKDLAAYALGSYCSFCERRLPLGGQAWHKAHGRVLRGKVSTKLVCDLLLVCTQCAEHERADGPIDGLLLPDQAPMFSLRPGSPMHYRRKEVAVRYVDPKGDTLGAVVRRKLVIIEARSSQAQATIDRFALNSPWYDAEAGRIDLPMEEHWKGSHTLVEQRTDAWEQAEQFRSSLAAMPNEQTRTLFTEQLRQIIELMGHWSVVATVFAGHEPGLLGHLLPALGAEPPGEEAPFGAFSQFRSTNPEGLFHGR